MNKPLASLVFAVAAFAGIVPASQATLVSQQQSVFDSATGYEWLKIPLTAGMSYNSVLASNYVTQQGYSFASEAQLTRLFQDAGGVVDTNCCSFSSTRSSVSDLIDIFGGPTSAIPGYGNLWTPAMWGTDGNIALMDIEAYNAGTLSLRWSSSPPTVSMRGDVGAFLVRNETVVPEPATLALFALGAAAVALLRRKNRG